MDFQDVRWWDSIGQKATVAEMSTEDPLYQSFFAAFDFTSLHSTTTHKYTNTERCKKFGEQRTSPILFLYTCTCMHRCTVIQHNRCFFLVIHKTTQHQMESNQTLYLKWDQFSENVKQSFTELKSNGDFFDVTLACDDQQIEAHKVIILPNCICVCVL